MLADPLDDPALVIFDGSPASMAAAGLLREPDKSVIWIAPSLPGRRGAINAAAECAAQATGATRIESPPGDQRPAAGALDEARLLLDAAESAVRRGLRSVILPAALGEADLDDIAATVDRCSLATALASLRPRSKADSAGADRPIVISAPLVDLTDAQVAELVLDLSLPLEACAVCETGEASPCQACPGCRRWARALEAARGAFDVASALSASASG